jgi:hypothetical protein
MKYIKSFFSIFLIVLLSITMFPGFCAVKCDEKVEYNANTKYVKFNQFPLSYNKISNKSFEKQDKTKSRLNVWGDQTKFSKSRDLIANSVKKTKNKLRPGDIVRVKNFDSTFLVYLGRDSNGEMHLENIHQKFKWSPQYFEKIYTGKTIEIRYNSSNEKTKESNIIIEDPSLNNNLVEDGTRPQSDHDWNNAENDPRIIALAESITMDKDTPQEKCTAIFQYIQQNYQWHDHDDTICSIGEVLETKTGNCCEMSRLMNSMVKSLDIPVETRYKHVSNYYYQTHKTAGHIYTQFKFEDGEWVDADVSSDYTSFGHESNLYKVNYVMAYYDSLPF